MLETTIIHLDIEMFWNTYDADLLDTSEYVHYNVSTFHNIENNNLAVALSTSFPRTF